MSHALATRLLHAIRDELVAHPPKGVDSAYVSGFFARNYHGLLTELAAALLPVLDEVEPLPPPLPHDLHEDLEALRAALLEQHFRDEAELVSAVVAALTDDQLGTMLHVRRAGVDTSEDQDLTWIGKPDIAAVGGWLRDRLAISLALETAGGPGSRVPWVLDVVLPQLRLVEERARVKTLHSPMFDAALRYHQGQATREEVFEAAPAWQRPLLPQPPPEDRARVLPLDPSRRRRQASMDDVPPRPPSTPAPVASAAPASLPVDPEEVRKGMRVVLKTGEHGEVTQVSVSTVSSGFLGGPRNVERHVSYRVKLDSGREVYTSPPLELENGPPPLVVPDVSFNNGATFMAPADAWRELRDSYATIAVYQGRERSARHASKKAAWRRNADDARKTFLAKFKAWAAWRWQHPEVAIPGINAKDERLYALEARSELDTEEAAELVQLRSAPDDWATRWQVGDQVSSGVAGRTWTIVGIEGHEAMLDWHGSPGREPLWKLQRAGDINDPNQLPPKIYAESRYVVDIGGDLLVSSGRGAAYPPRAAVSRAVKDYLASHQVQVRTRVRDGSMVTGISLYPASGTFSATDKSRLNALLENLRIYGDEASFDPWQRDPPPSSPYDDYGGKGAGLAIPAAHIPEFERYLARALRAAGEPLSRLGEARLAELERPAGGLSASAAGPFLSRGGVSAEQRQAAASGCQPLVFDLPSFGRIEVVCGQEGQRDTWHNVWIGRIRYGFNGGRWAKGLVAPAEVLAAIRERGVTIFGG